MRLDGAEPEATPTQSDVRIRVDIWSDVMCPWCYLGDAMLARALAGFEHRDRVDVEYHSYQLMPELPADVSLDLTELLVETRGFDPAQMAQMNQQIVDRGRAVGLDYRFDRAIATNTRRAHELSHFALAAGKQHAQVQRLFAAYFTEGRNLGELSVLAELAKDVGLDPDAALTALQSGEYAAAVDDDIERGRTIGVSGVPFFVFNMKYAVSGAQPVEVFAQVLDRLWAESSAT